MRFRFSFLFDDRNNRTARTHTEESSTNLSIVGRGDFTKKKEEKKVDRYFCMTKKNTCINA